MSDRNYVAVAPCGHFRAALVVSDDDGPDQKRGHARDIASWVRRGYSVEQRCIDEVRDSANWVGCDACKARGGKR